MAHLSAPPYFLDMEWPSQKPFAAPASDDFWSYNRVGYNRLKSIGITCKMIAGVYVVKFNPRKADDETIRTTMAAIRVDIHAAAIKASEARAHALKRDDEMFRANHDGRSREEDRVYQRELRTAKHAREVQEAIDLADQVAAAKAEARALFEFYGDFTYEKPRLHELLASASMNSKQLDELLSLIAGTKSKSDMRLALARTETGGVTWPDHVVIAAVRYLTALDADRATDPNHEGWSKASSPGGHWANAMLDREPAAAIAAARLLVGRHADQLREGGIL